MGNIPSNHVNIWHELCRIEKPAIRLKMLETLIVAPEYINSLKATSLYSEIISWIANTNKGRVQPWPEYKPISSSGNTLAKVAPAKKAMDYLHEAYNILGIADEDPLTPEVLKTAYKKCAKAHHPDRGGNPEIFDSMTKAYLYLTEVYNKLIPVKGRISNDTPVTMESAKKYRNDPVLNHDDGVSLVIRDPDMPVQPVSRQPTAPVILNPKKLDMNVFNQLFEQNRLPDPEKDDGYGDWLSTQTDAVKKNSTALRGKFNIDVFNKAFEKESQDLATSSNITKYNSPDELVLNPNAVVLGGEKPSEYTAPIGSKTHYTDLKAAYSTRTVFSNEVQNVRLDNKKTFSQVKEEREKDPGPASVEEMRRIDDMKRLNEMNERQRQIRLASNDTNINAHHDRMRTRMLIKE